MKVLVTGGAGYIGSHTCKALAQQGIVPVVLDNFVRGHEWAVQWGPCYRADLSETKKISEILTQEKIEAVLHFAAYAYVGESVSKPLMYYRNNVLGTLSLLESMRMADVSKILLSSTCAIYGVSENFPIEETFPQKPINPYGKTKWMVERILEDYGSSHGLSAVSLRYFNASGADVDLQIGEDHVPETHLIPLAIEAAYSGKKLMIYGGDYPTPDGTCIRDYIHVTDLADAHVLGLRRLVAGKEGLEVFNLGTGQGASVKQVILEVERITQRRIAVQLGDRRVGDPPELVASGDLAKMTLGWKPRFSNLGEIIDSSHRWYRQHWKVN